MVKYAESGLEKLINKLVLISIIILVVMLAIEFSMDITIYELYFDMVDLVINIIFIVDLVFIYKKSHSTTEFLKKNWIDIIACVPFNNLFRAAKLVRITKIAKIATKQSKLISRLPKFLRNFRIIRTTKLLSKETDFDRHIDYTKDKIFELKLQKFDYQLNEIIKELNKLEKNNN